LNCKEKTRFWRSWFSAEDKPMSPDSNVFAGKPPADAVKA